MDAAVDGRSFVESCASHEDKTLDKYYTTREDQPDREFLFLFFPPQHRHATELNRKRQRRVDEGEDNFTAKAHPFSFGDF